MVRRQSDLRIKLFNFAAGSGEDDIHSNPAAPSAVTEKQRSLIISLQ